MKPTVTRGATHLFAKPENWDAKTMDGECGDLQVRAETFGEANVVELISTRRPTKHELKMLNEGGVVEIGLCTANQPAMRAYVVKPVPHELDGLSVEECLARGLDPLSLKDNPPLSGVEKAPITINEDAHGHG